MYKKELVNNIRINIFESLSQLSLAVKIEDTKIRKTLLDSLQKLSSIYLSNIERLYVDSKDYNVSYLINSVDVNFIRDVSNILKEEVNKHSLMMRQLQNNNDHKAYHDSIITYEKLILTNNKFLDEFRISEKSLAVLDNISGVTFKCTKGNNKYIIDVDIIKAISPVLNKRLNDAYKNGTLIKTDRSSRGIGKTTSLVEFARENSLDIIVSYQSIAKNIKDNYNYDRVYSINEAKDKGIKSGVIDEHIDFSELENIKILTGYLYEQ